jgi:beta-alanine degradation protein BauB
MLFQAIPVLLPLLFVEPAAVPPDPTVTDPDKYKVILENQAVRMLDYSDKPGDTTQQHHHKPFVLYVLSDFKRKLTFPDGTVRVREFKTGEVLWMDEQTHVGQNVGTTPSHALLVEPKLGDKPTAPTSTTKKVEHEARPKK